MGNYFIATPRKIGKYISVYRYLLINGGKDKSTYIYVKYNIKAYIFPVVPHKAVAEVSKIGHYRRGGLLWCMDGRANQLMDWKVVGVVFFEVVKNGCSGHLVDHLTHNCWMECGVVQL